MKQSIKFWSYIRELQMREQIQREPCCSVLCITGFVILNSDTAVMTTLGHTMSMSPDHVPANKAH